MSQRFMTLRRFEQPADAEYYKEVLQNAHIPCSVIEERTGKPPQAGILPHTGGPILLKVPENDTDRAEQTLKSHSKEDEGNDPAVS